MQSLQDYDYYLPKEAIAQSPTNPRDRSRLLVLDKNSGQISDKYFFEIADFLKKGDVLVMNNSKVFPARLFGKKASGGKLEVFLHRCLDSGRAQPAEKDKQQASVWQCLIGGRGAKSGLDIFFEKELSAQVLKDNQDGTWELAFNLAKDKMMAVVEKIGQTPLPPYIKRPKSNNNLFDKERYQTVYADAAKAGSVAAPTAGLHFTPELISGLKKQGVEIEYLTLHVGLGTFAPVKTEDIARHKMHAEYVEIPRAVIARLYAAKHRGRRIIAVGTTSARSLEALAGKQPIGRIKFPDQEKNAQAEYKKQFADFREFVDIFIYPPYQLKMADAMITNFHLPKSTLLMLVSALAGKKNIDQAYQHAIANHYRFYSYGDAMLIA